MKIKNFKKFIIILIVLALIIVFVLLYFFVPKVKENVDKIIPNKAETQTETETTVIEETTEIRHYQTIQSGTYYDDQSQRATMDVDFKDGVYYFTINWSNSASENVKWTFSGKFNKDILGVSYANEKCVYENYDEDGKVTETGIFEDGKGVMRVDSKTLYWDDLQEPKKEGEQYNAIFRMPVEVSGFTGTQQPIVNNTTNNYYGTTYNGSAAGVGAIDNHTFTSFSIVGYDREAYEYYNGEPMCTRIPIIGGTNYYLVNIANGLIKNAYASIASWCNNNVFRTNVQDFFLNYASIESQSSSQIVMNVNCALKVRGVLNGHHEFRLVLDLTSNRYRWNKIDYSTSTKKKEKTPWWDRP